MKYILPLLILSAIVITACSSNARTPVPEANV